MKLVVLCKEVLKVNTHTLVYTKKYDEDEESASHITAQSEQDTLSQMEVDEELKDITWCYHISISDGNPQEDKDIGDALSELEKESRLQQIPCIDVNPRTTYLSAFLEVD